MKFSKKQKTDVENAQSADVELSEEQLDVVSGGVIEGPNGCCISLPDFVKLPDEFLPKAPDVKEYID
jgi:hypothetical protein